MDTEKDSVLAEQTVRAMMPDFSKMSTSAVSILLAPIANDRRLKEAEKAFSDALQTLRKERYGDEGTWDILEYLNCRDDEEDDEEEPEEPKFNFSKKDAMAAAEFLQKVAHHRPDLEVALPLAGNLHKFRSALSQEVEETKVQTNITSFFK
ncbi:hypothetical protein B0H14DRAFT_2580793 [Mycena olivaceomarginata]|nr:hypothetical protein B0H14DRAFT_2580793 [Mycena olivaceomarginata]